MSDTNELKTLISNMQAAFRADPQQAKAVFTSKSGPIQGFRTTATLGNHEITVDEPQTMGGTGTGPNPIELVLAALGTCQEITYRAYAVALDIPLQEVRVELEGDIDMRGFFAVDDSVRPGFSSVRGTVHLVSSASAEQIETLHEVVNRHCPVMDMLSQPVPIELAVAHERSDAAAA